MLPGQDPRRRADELEMRVVVERPADRHLDERASPRRTPRAASSVITSPLRTRYGM